MITQPPGATSEQPGYLACEAFILGIEAYAASLRRLLEREKWSLTSFSDGRDLVAALHRGSPDVVVVDLDSGSHRGHIVAEVLRQRGYRGAIVLLKTEATELEIVASLEAGADEYLSKDLGISELVARLRAVLRRTMAPSAVAQGDVVVARGPDFWRQHRQRSAG